MNGTFFDVVFDKAVRPVFNGTEEETVKWLRERPEMRFKDYGVCIGRSSRIVSVDSYLIIHEEREARRRDTVVHNSGEHAIFNGTTEETVKWLEDNPSNEPRWVYTGETGDILTESEYLDLAS